MQHFLNRLSRLPARTLYYKDTALGHLRKFWFCTDDQDQSAPASLFAPSYVQTPPTQTLYSDLQPHAFVACSDRLVITTVSSLIIGRGIIVLAPLDA
uniref:Uncharacterized protein n=1 Tax=Steinernema glaseri TaxID=37863 RepID=A0A1I7Z5L0_9BILA